MKEKFEKMKEAIMHKEKLIVELSGGVDSSLLAKIAYDALGDHAIAAIVDTETFSHTERDKAIEISKEIGISYRILESTILNNSKFSENNIERCFFCRMSRGSLILENFPNLPIADGMNMDDLSDYRPGKKAADLLKVWHPFIEFNIEKSEIREQAKELGLSNYNDASESCLASRISYGIQVTKRDLGRVNKVEDILREMGFYPVRARIFPGELLKIEVSEGQIYELLNNETRTKLIEMLEPYNFSHVSIDIEGYKTGKMNRGIVKH